MKFENFNFEEAISSLTFKVIDHTDYGYNNDERSKVIAYYSNDEVELVVIPTDDGWYIDFFDNETLEASSLLLNDNFEVEEVYA
jgi:hypothetical protein